MKVLKFDTVQELGRGKRVSMIDSKGASSAIYIHRLALYSAHKSINRESSDSNKKERHSACEQENLALLWDYDKRWWDKWQ